MEADGTDDDLRRRLEQIHRQARWLVTLLEGLAAAGFLAFQFRKPIGAPATLFGFGVTKEAALAFFVASVVTYIGWPYTRSGASFSAFRIFVFAIVIILLGSLLWLGLVPLMQAFGNARGVPMSFADTVVGAVVVLLAFGWLLVPLSIGVALAVAYWAAARLQRVQGAGRAAP